jgi:predicted MFS family arabinose efflux permease
VLFVNVPIAVVLAFAAPRVLAAGTPRPGRLDVPGALTVTGGMTLVVYGLSRAATQGWSDNATIASLGIGAALLVLFALVELRSPQPLMPLRLFGNRNRTGAYALRMVAGSMSLAVLFFLSQIVQNVLGYTPLEAGFAFLPLGIGVVVTAQLASRLVGRSGPRTLIAFGAGVLAGGLFLLSRITDHASYAPDILVPLAILSAGFGLIFLPTTVVAVSGAARHESGLASALLNVSQQLGGSIGLAVLGNVAVNVAKEQHSLTTGFTTTFQIGGWVAIAGLVLALVAIRVPTRRKLAESLPEAA